MRFLDPNASLWRRCLVIAAFLAGYLSALSGSIDRNGWPAGFGGIFGLGAALYRDWTFLRLPADDRGRVDRATRTGRSTGSEALDGIAIERVQRRAASYRYDRVLLPVLFLLMPALAIIATVRHGDWLWLLTAMPTVFLIPALVRPDPRPILVTLRRRTSF